ncbi:MAG: LmbU family transcriptional regulator [Gaiellaceae bacterium]
MREERMQQACVEVIDSPRPARGAGEDDAVRDLQIAISMTPTAWAVSGDLSLLEWSQSGRRLGVIGRGTGWWIGDWVHYGNARFGERYVRAARITGYDVQTLMNMVYVASRFAPSRRRPNLSFSHHAELAALPTDEQDHWLERAEAERLSVRCLREEVRRARRAAEAEAEPEMEELAEPDEEVVCPHCGAHFTTATPELAEA